MQQHLIINNFNKLSNIDDKLCNNITSYNSYKSAAHSYTSKTATNKETIKIVNHTKRQKVSGVHNGVVGKSKTYYRPTSLLAHHRQQRQ